MHNSQPKLGERETLERGEREVRRGEREARERRESGEREVRESSVGACERGERERGEREREVRLVPAIIQGDVSLVEKGIEGEEQNARRRPRPVEPNHSPISLVKCSSRTKPLTKIAPAKDPA